MLDDKDKEKCPNADSNPLCPYLTRIETMENSLNRIDSTVDKLKEKIATILTDIEWLKKGYWLQTLLSVGTFLTVLGLILKLAGVV